MTESKDNKRSCGDNITIAEWEKFKKKFNKNFDFGSMSIHREDVLNYIYKELLAKK